LESYRIGVLGPKSSNKSEYVEDLASCLNYSGSFSDVFECERFDSINEKKMGSEIDSSEFKLVHFYDEILIFSVCDLSNEIIKNRVESTQLYNVQNIIVYIDGEVFCVDDHNEIQKKLKREYARIVNQYLSEYVEKNGYNPLTIFVIDKADLIEERMDNIYPALSNIFSNIFNDDICSFTILVDRFHTDAKLLPYIISLYFYYNDRYEIYKKELEKQLEELNNRKNEKDQYIAEQEKRLIFKNYIKLRESKNEVTSLSIEIEKLNDRKKNNELMDIRNDLYEYMIDIMNGNRTSLIHGFQVFGYKDAKWEDKLKEKQEHQINERQESASKHSIYMLLVFYLIIAAILGLICYLSPIIFAVAAILLSIYWYRVKENNILPIIMAVIVVLRFVI